MLLMIQSCVQVLMTRAPLNIFPAEDWGKVAGPSDKRLPVSSRPAAVEGLDIDSVSTGL